MRELEVSYSCRKALTVHLGDRAGTEVAELLQQLVARIEALERGKVDVMPIISPPSSKNSARQRRAG